MLQSPARRPLKASVGLTREGERRGSYADFVFRLASSIMHSGCLVTDMAVLGTAELRLQGEEAWVALVPSCGLKMDTDPETKRAQTTTDFASCTQSLTTLTLIPQRNRHSSMQLALKTRFILVPSYTLLSTHKQSTLPGVLGPGAAARASDAIEPMLCWWVGWLGWLDAKWADVVTMAGTTKYP